MLPSEEKGSWLPTMWAEFKAATYRWKAPHPKMGQLSHPAPECQLFTEWNCIVMWCSEAGRVEGFKISVDNGCLELELQTFRPCLHNISIMHRLPIQLPSPCQGAGGRSCSYLFRMNTKSERVAETFHRKVWCLWHAGENSRARTACKLKGRKD